jgi:branched-chain amino acid transport system substrate-binding protein
VRHSSLIKVGVPIVVSALALSACGSRKSSANPGTTTTKTFTIALDAPLTGSLAPLGLGMEHSVDLAIKKANSTNEVPGVQFKFVFKDDQAKPNIGQDNATALVGQADVLGVVGPLNSSVAQSEQKVFNDANLVQVSPANTNPSLTRGADWATAPARQYNSYFRTCATDDLQGPFAADYVFNTLKFTKVSTVNDGKTYGKGLVDTFTKEFTKLGGQVVSTDVVGEADTDFSGVVNHVKPAGAQLLYYGGEYPVAAPLSLQLKNAGSTIPVMGGDGVYDDKYLTLAGGKGNGDFATSVGAPTAKQDSAKKFVTDYAAANYPDAYSAYGAYSYDAAWAIIEAVKAASAGGKTPTRADVLAAMSSVSFTGATGSVAFDKYGDTTNKVLTMYTVKDGAWTDILSKSFGS